MIAEYSHAHGGPPDPAMSWPLFAVLAALAPALRARSALAQFDATAAAIASAFGVGGPNLRAAFERAAHPERRDRAGAPRRWIPNRFAEQ